LNVLGYAKKFKDVIEARGERTAFNAFTLQQVGKNGEYILTNHWDTGKIKEKYGGR